MFKAQPVLVKSQRRKCWNRHDEELEMLNQIKKFMLDDSGLETVEWAIVGGVIVAGAAVIFLAIGTDVGRGLGNLSAETLQIP